MKSICYLRVSSSEQDVASQRGAIADFCKSNNIAVTEWMEMEISSRKSLEQRGIDDLLKSLRSGDELIVSEISRISRSVGEIAVICERLLKKKVRLIAIKERIDLRPSDGKDMDIQTLTMITMFSLFANIERSVCSIRTREGMRAAKARGAKIGNPRILELKGMMAGKAREFASTMKPTVLPMVRKGMGPAQIAKELNRMGIRAKRGGEWQTIQAEHLLKFMEG